MSDHVSSSPAEASDRLAIRHHDTFAKTGGTWRFAERRLDVRWIETRMLEGAGGG